MTQCELVLKYIDDFGSITPIEAKEEFTLKYISCMDQTRTGAWEIYGAKGANYNGT